MTRSHLLVGIVLDTTSPHRISTQAIAAERAGLNFLLFDDGRGAPGVSDPRWGLDPIESASYASAVTEAIGLVATAAATHAEPYHLSNRFSSLDWGSRGRAGWLVTLDASEARARAYAAPVPDGGEALREADAVIDAVRRLWDSWEDGALLADTATGRFLDADKLHYVDAGGELFSIKGPALMPRPIQGQIPVLSRAADRLTEVDIVIGDGPGARVFAEVTGDDDPLPILRELAGQVDGVLLTGVDAEDLGGLSTLVADGILAPPHPGQTFRGQLGLPRPAGRYAPPANPNPTAADQAGTNPAAATTTGARR